MTADDRDDVVASRWRRGLHRQTWGPLLRLGWPVSLTMLVRVTMRTVDVLVVGIVVGATGVAAVGIGDAFARLLLMTTLGLGAGTIAMVSQHVGAGERTRADEAVTQSIVLAVAIGVPFTIAGLTGAEAFFRVLGAAPDVVSEGGDYLRIVIATAVPRAVAIVLTRAFHGAGDTRTPLLVRTIGTGINIALTVLLVGGVGAAPALGVRGAAIGTATGNVLSAGLLMAVLLSGRRQLGIARHGWWAPRTARQILVVAWPHVIERTWYALALIPLNAVILTFGTVANAGFQVGRRVQLYALLPSRGVATAASSFVGRYLGAGRLDESERYGRGAAWLGLLVSGVVALPVFVFATPIATVFLGGETDAVPVAAAWLRTYAVATIVRTFFDVPRGALQGAGVTRPPMIATVIGTLVFLVGFSWFAGIVAGAGVAAVMAGVVLDPLARVAVLSHWLRGGRWRAGIVEAGDRPRMTGPPDSRSVPSRARATGARARSGT